MPFLTKLNSYRAVNERRVESLYSTFVLCPQSQKQKNSLSRGPPNQSVKAILVGHHGQVKPLINPCIDDKYYFFTSWIFKKLLALKFINETYTKTTTQVAYL